MPIAKNQILTIGQVATRSGVPVSTLHFYENLGLIEGWRTKGNQRRFARQVLRRIAIIRIAQQAGLPLAQIKSQLGVGASAPITAKQWAKLSADWGVIVNERIAHLVALRDQLETSIGCGCVAPQTCPLCDVNGPPE